MSYKACADYCPVVTGEEDMCLKDPSCYRKAGVTEVIKAEAPSRVQRIIEALRARQAAKAAENIALAHE